MIAEIIETIKILEKEGFDKKEAIGIIIANELNYLEERLNEFSNKQ
jgi:hypothetical protein